LNKFPYSTELRLELGNKTTDPKKMQAKRKQHKVGKKHGGMPGCVKRSEGKKGATYCPRNRPHQAVAAYAPELPGK
jgi:hypothetical protein